MLRPFYRNVLLYFFVKYLFFYIFLMFKNSDYSLIQIGALKNSQDVFYYLWIFLSLPILNSIFFSAPLYYSFKLKKGISFVLLWGAILIAEYFLYTYLASQADLMNGVYNGILSVIVLLLFFYKEIALIFNSNKR